MAKKIQFTRLHKSSGLALKRIDEWASNPWRRYSLLTIVFLVFFLFGSAIGMINGVLALMDPVGALITVLSWEFMVRIRRFWSLKERQILSCQVLDFARMGMLYGLLVEGSKLFG